MPQQQRHHESAPSATPALPEQIDQEARAEDVAATLQLFDQLAQLSSLQKVQLADREEAAQLAKLHAELASTLNSLAAAAEALADSGCPMEQPKASMPEELLTEDDPLLVADPRAAEHCSRWAAAHRARPSWPPAVAQLWDSFHLLPPLGTAEDSQELPQEAVKQIQQLLSIVAEPEQHAMPEGWTEADWQAWEAQLAQLLPDPDAFQAHSLRQRYPVWEKLLRSASNGPDGKLAEPAKKVLKRLRQGCRFDFVRPDSAEQQQHPRYKQNMQRISRHLEQVYGQEAAARMLDADEPQACFLPNHRSFEQHGQFGREAVSKLHASGSLKKWPFPWPPKVVLPLGVAIVEGRKPRLVLDGGYTNLYCRYRQFRYEPITDLTAYLEQGDFGTGTDATSGFYHWSLHPDHWQYAGICVDGEYYVFTVPAFGLAPAPRWYTEGMQEVFRIVRRQGVRMTFMIDDQCNWASTEGQAKAQCEAMVRLLAALGFYLRPDKCQLRPVRRLRFLGLEVDAAQLRFWVPEDKLQRFVNLAQQALQPFAQLSNRLLARLAGMLLSFMLAVDIAPLLARSLYHAMVGRSSWDSLFPTTDDLRQTLMWCVSLVCRYNGSRMLKRHPSLVLVGDASDSGCAGFTPNGELAGLSLGDFVATWPADKLPLVHQAEFSSTVREVLTPRLMLEALLQQAPQLVLSRRVQYQSDSQPAVAAINGMSGNPTVFGEVRQLVELCKEHDVELEAVWYPRTAPLQQLADELSKLVDGSQWALSEAAWQFICTEVQRLPQPLPRRITVDLFADDQTHKVPAFFSRWFCPGTSGINAFSQRWDGCRLPDGSWQRHLAYCNGPFDCMGSIIRKIIDDTADTILVYPNWPRPWQQMLQRLKRTPGVVLPDGQQRQVLFQQLRLDTQQLRRHLFQAGERAPQATGSYREPRYEVVCAFILWAPCDYRPQC